MTCSTMDCTSSPKKLEFAEEEGEGVFLEDKVEIEFGRQTGQRGKVVLI